MQALLKEARQAWAGLWLFVRGRDAEAIAQFADDNPALVRSFVAGLTSLVVSALLVHLADPENVSGMVDPFPVYVRNGLLNWIVWLGVAWLLARLFDAGARFRLYVVTLNWMSAYLALLLDPPTALLLRLNEVAGGIVLFALLAFIAIVMVRQARASLGISTGKAVLLVLLAFIATVAALVVVDPSIFTE